MNLTWMDILKCAVLITVTFGIPTAIAYLIFKDVRG